jgi:hypothetical protein
MSSDKKIEINASPTQVSFIQDWDNLYQIAVGAIRSGKSYGQKFKIRDMFITHGERGIDMILSGKTVDAVKRNVLNPLIQLLSDTGEYRLFKLREQPLTLTYLPKNITLWVFGANDESSWERVMGMTAQAFFADELTLHPESFVEKCIERTSAGKRFKIWTSNNDAPTHYLKTKYIDNPALGKFLREYKFLLKDNPILSAQYIEELYATHKGVNRDRYLEAKWAANTDELIVPEIHEREELVVRDYERPTACHKLVTMDPGYDDYCAIIFGYYDFENAVGVVEESIFLRGANTRTIARAISDTENRLWGSEGPYGRYSDIQKTLIRDLMDDHGIVFSEARKGKGNKGAKVNKIRTMIDDGQLVILPNNEKLVYQLKTGQWTPIRSGFNGEENRNFIRTKEEGHFDGIDALGDWCRYLPVNIKPRYAKAVYGKNMHVPIEGVQDDFEEVRRAMFGWNRIA